MNLSSWMILVFLLSAGTSLAAVDVNWLTRVVDVILRTVKEHGLSDRRQFSLAANIPLNKDPNTLQGVLNIDSTFKKTLRSGATYQSSSLVTAQTVGADHAEYLVLLALQPLMDNSAGHVLIIYSLKSPCLYKCTAGNDDYSILPLIRDRVIPRWAERAVFVFTTVYDKYGNGDQIPRENVIQSLENLGVLAIGLANIFRCYPPVGSDFQCYSCSVGNRVSEVCVDNNFVAGQGGSSSQIRERSRSPSRGSFIGPQIPGGSSSRGGFIGPQIPGGSSSRGGFIGPQIPGGSSSQIRERSRSSSREGSTSQKRGRYKSPGGSSSNIGQSRSSSRSGDRRRRRSRSGSSSRKSERFYGLM